MAVDWRKAVLVGLRLDPSKFAQDIAAAKKKLRAFGADVEKFLGKKVMKGGLLGRGGGMLAGVGKGIAAGIGFGGVAGIASVVGDVLSFEKALTRFQIATDKTPEQLAAFRAELGALSTATGISRNELLGGAQAYVALTGDVEGATQTAAVFAKVANATGASMQDIAGSAAAMKDNMKIDPADFEAAFSALHVQGKAGAVELRELATELAGVTPTFTQFAGGKGVTGLIDLGSALQAVRKGFGSSSEAATGLQSLMVAITKNAGRFEGKGVNVFTTNSKTGKKELRGLLEIVDDIAKSDLAKDPTKLTKAFGRDEARRAYEQLVNNRDLLDDLRKKSADQGAIARDAMTFQTSTAGRLAIALETLKTKIADVFTPERIAGFVDALGKLVDLLGTAAQFVDWISKGMPKARETTTAEKKLGGAVNRNDLVDMATERELGERRAAAKQAKQMPSWVRDRLMEEINREQATLNSLQVADTLEFRQQRQADALRGQLAGRGAKPEDLAGKRLSELLALQTRMLADGLRPEITVKLNDEKVATAVEKSRDQRRTVP